MNKDDPIVKHIDFLVRNFEQQVAEGQSHRFVFPQPANGTEREALRLFVALIEARISLPVQLDLTGRSCLTLILPPHRQAMNDER